MGGSALNILLVLRSAYKQAIVDRGYNSNFRDRRNTKQNFCDFELIWKIWRIKHGNNKILNLKLHDHIAYAGKICLLILRCEFRSKLMREKQNL